MHTKPETIPGLYMTSGLFMRKPYIVVVMTKNVKNGQSANKAIANISKMIYDYVVKQSGKDLD